MDVLSMALWNRPNEALEATGYSLRFLAGVDLYPVARASAWALGCPKAAGQPPAKQHIEVTMLVRCTL
jgi:hypothetical protein